MVSKKEKLAQNTLFNAAAIAAMKYSHRYKGYEDAEKAFKALKRRCPGFSQEQCRYAWEKGRALYGAASELIKKQDYSDDEESLKLCLKEKKTKKEWGLIDAKRNERIEAATKMLELRHSNMCSLFQRSTIVGIIDWVYYWTIER
jgi:hypothetical protein